MTIGVEESEATLEPTDADLLGRATRDEDAFALFYRRHAEFVLAWCYRRTADAETAADLTMETFAAAFAFRRRFRPDISASARPWLLGIARNHLRKLAHRGRMSTKYRSKLNALRSIDLGASDIDRVEELVDLEPVRGTLRAALDDLPVGQAEAVWLRVGLGLPYATVAQRLGCTPGAARVRVTRGMSRLGERL